MKCWPVCPFSDGWMTTPTLMLVPTVSCTPTGCTVPGLPDSCGMCYSISATRASPSIMVELFTSSSLFAVRSTLTSPSTPNSRAGRLGPRQPPRTTCMTQWRWLPTELSRSSMSSTSWIPLNLFLPCSPSGTRATRLGGGTWRPPVMRQDRCSPQVSRSPASTPSTHATCSTSSRWSTLFSAHSWRSMASRTPSWRR
jgi:hypothetical protein